MGLQGHGAVDPVGVVGDDGVDTRLLHLTTFLPAVGCDPYGDALVDQRSARISLKQSPQEGPHKTVTSKSCIIPSLESL